MARALHSGFIRSAELFPNRPAIEVEGQILAYRELYAKAASIAATLQDRAPVVEPPLTAVFAYHSVISFAGVLAALFRGHGYVPLNPTFPSDRTRTMLLRSGCSTIVVDRESTKQLDEIFQGITQPILPLPRGKLSARCRRVSGLYQNWIPNVHPRYPAQSRRTAPHKAGI